MRLQLLLFGLLRFLRSIRAKLLPGILEFSKQPLLHFVWIYHHACIISDSIRLLPVALFPILIISYLGRLLLVSRAPFMLPPGMCALGMEPLKSRQSRLVRIVLRLMVLLLTLDYTRHIHEHLIWGASWKEVVIDALGCDRLPAIIEQVTRQYVWYIGERLLGWLERCRLLFLATVELMDKCLTVWRDILLTMIQWVPTFLHSSRAHPSKSAFGLLQVASGSEWLQILLLRCMILFFLLEHSWGHRWQYLLFSSGWGVVPIGCESRHVSLVSLVTGQMPLLLMKVRSSPWCNQGFLSFVVN